jgi:hypothetical protein
VLSVGTSARATILLKAKGNSLKNSSLLSCYPVKNSFEVKVEVKCGNETESGLLLQTSSKYFPTFIKKGEI